MAFGDTVQSVQGSVASGAVSATLASGATAGNLLIFSVGRSGDNTGAWDAISGFTDLNESNFGAGPNIGAKAWYRIAAGGETLVSTGGTNEAGNACAALVEYEGPFAAGPLDVQAEDETNLATVVTSQSSGTTAATAQADELAVAIFAADNGSNVDGTRTLSNSFTEVLFANSGARASSLQAKKVLSATGTQECTFSVTDTGDEQYGQIATFKKSVGGGGAPPVSTMMGLTGVGR